MESNGRFLFIDVTKYVYENNGATQVRVEMWRVVG
jgi:hypothetical protein